MVEVALRSYFLTSASESKLTNSEEVQETISGLSQQCSGRERYPKQGLEASPTASGIPPGPDF